jgi:preprotein translocase subunit SecD
VLQRNLRWLVGILLVAAVATYIAMPYSPGIHLSIFGLKINQDFPIKEGLDLQGGIQVLLEADVPDGTAVDPQSMDAAIGIVNNRVNALGVSEPLVQQASGNRIVVQLPGIKDPDQAVRTIGQTGLLEFIDAGASPPPVGTVVTTTLGGPSTIGNVGGATISATTGVTTTVTADQLNNPYANQTFSTVMSGPDLQTASVSFDQFNQPQIDFVLNDSGSKKFGDFTTANIGKYLAITMDKKVIEAPRIQGAITGGRGQITGKFTLVEATDLVIQLKYGALPVPLKVVNSSQVGPTLGAEAVRQSILAGIIGLAIVLSFMILYYRVPGVLADVALLIYAAVAFCLFRVIPVTLTLAGIAGFILSIGMAVDANILIFERMKEEMRAGRTLHAAIDAGFERAWTSIRDSNLSTLITCLILYWFGSTFGASIIQGFAFTLALGVGVSLLSATIVTRTFMRLLVETGWVRNPRLYGLDDLKEGAR